MQNHEKGFLLLIFLAINLPTVILMDANTSLEISNWANQKQLIKEDETYIVQLVQHPINLTKLRFNNFTG
jgi:hypothetical protein